MERNRTIERKVNYKMGISFSNIQIFNPNHNNKYEVDDDYCIEHLTSDWDTILDDVLDVEIEMFDEAIILSKRIHDAVIFVEYFDDDYLTINVFREGKLIAYHYVGLDKKETKNKTAIVKALHVDSNKEELCVQIIDDVNSASEACYQLENICGIPLLTTMIDDEQDTYMN